MSEVTLYPCFTHDELPFWKNKATPQLGPEATFRTQIRFTIPNKSGVLVRTHERRWLFEEPTQSRIIPNLLQFTKGTCRRSASSWFFLLANMLKKNPFFTHDQLSL